MVRQTRHLWIGNLPERISEDRVREYFKRYGRVQNIKMLSGSGASVESGSGVNSPNSTSCTIAFMDIQSAAKTLSYEHKIDNKILTARYYEPTSVSVSELSSADRNTSNDDHRQTPTVSSTITLSSSLPSNTLTNGANDYSRVHHSHHHNRHTNALSSSIHHFNNRRGFFSSSSASSLPNASTGLYGNGHRVWALPSQSSVNFDNNRIRHRTNIDLPDEKLFLKRKPSRSHSHRKQNLKSSNRSSDDDSRSLSTSESGRSRSRSRTRSRSHSSSTSSSSASSVSISSSINSTKTTSSSSSVTSSSAKHRHQRHRRSSHRIGRKRQYRSKSKTRQRSRRHTTHYKRSISRKHRRSHTILIQNLPTRYSEAFLKDSISHECRRIGKIQYVRLLGQQLPDRRAVVRFKKSHDATRALDLNLEKSLFGSKIDILPYPDSSDEDVPIDNLPINEFHPKSSRVLTVSNLEKDFSVAELRKRLETMVVDSKMLLDIDIRKSMAITTTSIANCEFLDVISVVKVIREGFEVLKSLNTSADMTIKLEFGKSVATNCVWVDYTHVKHSSSSNTSLEVHKFDEYFLAACFSKFGTVAHVSVDKMRNRALVFFDSITSAQLCITEMRGCWIKGRRLQMDFASRECQDAFYLQMNAFKNGDITDDLLSFSTSTLSKNARYENNTTPPHPPPSSICASSTTYLSSTVNRPMTPTSTTPPRPPPASQSTPNASSHMSSKSQHHYHNHNHHNNQNQNQPLHAMKNICSQVTNSTESSTLETGDRNCPDNGPPLSLQTRKIATLQPQPQPQTPPTISQPSRINGNQVSSNQCNKSGSVSKDPKALSNKSVNSNNVSLLSSHRSSVDDTQKATVLNNSTTCGKATAISSSILVSNSLANSILNSFTNNNVATNNKKQETPNPVVVPDSNSVSRPGTPLCDEKPETTYPLDPRKLLHPKEDFRIPIDLPLPSFADHFLASFRIRNPSNTAQTTTPTATIPTTYITPLTIKTLQTHNALLSQKAAMTNSKTTTTNVIGVATILSNNVSAKLSANSDSLQQQQQQQQPKSPKTRSVSHLSHQSSPKFITRSPSSDSLSSSLSSSSPKSTSNNIDEQLRKVDALYEKWKNGSRVLSQTTDLSRKLESKSELLSNYKPLVEFESEDKEPSQLVEMILSRPSIFDDDSKRLENVREKFELKDLSQIKSSFLSSTTTSLINGLTSSLNSVNNVNMKTNTEKKLEPKLVPILKKDTKTTIDIKKPITSVATILTNTTTITSSIVSTTSLTSTITTTSSPVTSTTISVNTYLQSMLKRSTPSTFTIDSTIVETVKKMPETPPSICTPPLTPNISRSPIPPITNVTSSTTRSSPITTQVTIKTNVSDDEKVKSSNNSNSNNNDNNSKNQPISNNTCNNSNMNSLKKSTNDIKLSPRDKDHKDDEIKKQKPACDNNNVSQKQQKESHNKQKQSPQPQSQSQHHQVKPSKSQMDISKKHNSGSSSNISTTSVNIKESKDIQNSNNNNNKPIGNSTGSGQSKVDKKSSHPIQRPPSPQGPPPPESPQQPLLTSTSPQSFSSPTTSSVKSVTKPSLSSSSTVLKSTSSSSLINQSKSKHNGDIVTNNNNNNNSSSSNSSSSHHHNYHHHHHHHHHHNHNDDIKKSSSSSYYDQKSSKSLSVSNKKHDVSKKPSMTTSSSSTTGSSTSITSTTKLIAAKKKNQLQHYQKKKQQSQSQPQHVDSTTDSSSDDDSDEPKKKSIFDIEQEPSYISMYDKVKARSCKNKQQKQESEKMEIKAKFNQLKQSRAKREEKKRSTSCDEARNKNTSPSSKPPSSLSGDDKKRVKKSINVTSGDLRTDDDDDDDIDDDRDMQQRRKVLMKKKKTTILDSSSSENEAYVKLLKKKSIISDSKLLKNRVINSDDNDDMLSSHEDHKKSKKKPMMAATLRKKVTKHRSLIYSSDSGSDDVDNDVDEGFRTVDNDGDKSISLNSRFDSDTDISKNIDDERLTLNNKTTGFVKKYSFSDDNNDNEDNNMETNMEKENTDGFINHLKKSSKISKDAHLKRSNTSQINDAKTVDEKKKKMHKHHRRHDKHDKHHHRKKHKYKEDKKIKNNNDNNEKDNSNKLALKLAEKAIFGSISDMNDDYDDDIIDNDKKDRISDESSDLDFGNHNNNNSSSSIGRVLGSNINSHNSDNIDEKLVRHKKKKKKKHHSHDRQKSIKSLTMSVDCSEVKEEEKKAEEEAGHELEIVENKNDCMIQKTNEDEIVSEKENIIKEEIEVDSKCINDDNDNDNEISKHEDEDVNEVAVKSLETQMAVEHIQMDVNQTNEKNEHLNSDKIEVNVVKEEDIVPRNLKIETPPVPQSRITISNEETMSAVAAILNQNFGSDLQSTYDENNSSKLSTIVVDNSTLMQTLEDKVVEEDNNLVDENVDDEKDENSLVIVENSVIKDDDNDKVDDEPDDSMIICNESLDNDEDNDDKVEHSENVNKLQPLTLEKTIDNNDKNDTVPEVPIIEKSKIILESVPKTELNSDTIIKHVPTTISSESNLKSKNTIIINTESKIEEKKSVIIPLQLTVQKRPLTPPPLIVIQRNTSQVSQEQISSLQKTIRPLSPQQQLSSITKPMSPQQKVVTKPPNQQDIIRQSMSPQKPIINHQPLIPLQLTIPQTHKLSPQLSPIQKHAAILSRQPFIQQQPPDKQLAMIQESLSHFSYTPQLLAQRTPSPQQSVPHSEQSHHPIMFPHLTTTQRRLAPFQQSPSAQHVSLQRYHLQMADNQQQQQQQQQQSTSRHTTCPQLLTVPKTSSSLQTIVQKPIFQSTCIQKLIQPPLVSTQSQLQFPITTQPQIKHIPAQIQLQPPISAHTQLQPPMPAQAQLQPQSFTQPQSQPVPPVSTQVQITSPVSTQTQVQIKSHQDTSLDQKNQIATSQSTQPQLEQPLALKRSKSPPKTVEKPLSPIKSIQQSQPSPEPKIPESSLKENHINEEKKVTEPCEDDKRQQPMSPVPQITTCETQPINDVGKTVNEWETTKEPQRQEVVTRGTRGRGRGRGRVGRPAGSGKKKSTIASNTKVNYSSKKGTVTISLSTNKDIYEFQDESDDSHQHADYSSDLSCDKNVKETNSVDDNNEKSTPTVVMRKSKRIQERNSGMVTVSNSVSSLDEMTDDARANKIRRSSRQNSKVSNKNTSNQKITSMETVNVPISNMSTITDTTSDVSETTNVNESSNSVKAVDETAKDLNNSNRKNETEEPTTLIDPVTGVLTPMRQKDDGKYVPIVTHPPVGFVRSISDDIAPVKKRLRRDSYCLSEATQSVTTSTITTTVNNGTENLSSSTQQRPTLNNTTEPKVTTLRSNDSQQRKISFKAHILDRSRAEEELQRQQKENQQNLMNAFHASSNTNSSTMMPPPAPTPPYYQRHASSPFPAQTSHLSPTSGVYNAPNAILQQQYHQEQITKSKQQFLNPANLTATNEMNAIGTPMSSPSSAMPPPPCPSPSQMHSSQSHNFMGHVDVSTANTAGSDFNYYSNSNNKSSYQKPYIPVHQVPINLGAMASPPLHHFSSQQQNISGYSLLGKRQEHINPHFINRNSSLRTPPVSQYEHNIATSNHGGLPLLSPPVAHQQTSPIPTNSIIDEKSNIVNQHHNHSSYYHPPLSPHIQSTQSTKSSQENLIKHQRSAPSPAHTTVPSSVQSSPLPTTPPSAHTTNISHNILPPTCGLPPQVQLLRHYYDIVAVAPQSSAMSNNRTSSADRNDENISPHVAVVPYLTPRYTPPQASQVPAQADSLFAMLQQQYPIVWQGMLSLKNDQAAVQMYYISGNREIARASLPIFSDNMSAPLRIMQRMRLEQNQVEGVCRKMQIQDEHCILLALPCGKDHLDVLKQSSNLNTGFIQYLQQKQAAGIVNVCVPESHINTTAYIIHIFPSCDFVNDNLARINPNLLHRVSDLSHLFVVIATV